MERVKRILTDYRVVIWLVAFVALGIAPLLAGMKSGGVVVKKVSPHSPFYGKVAEGDVITWINERYVKSAEDVKKFEKYYGRVRMLVNGKLVIGDVNGNLGIEVEDKLKFPIKFGLDIGGGVRVILQPKENTSAEMLESVKKILERRINLFGLREARFTTVSVGGKGFIQIEMAGGNESEVRDVLERQGVFEAKVSKILPVSGNKSTLRVGGKSYEILLENGSIVINGKRYGINESFYLVGIKFEVANVSEKSVVLYAIVFNSSDVKDVCTVNIPGSCLVYLYPSENGYRYGFEVKISYSAAKNLLEVVRDEGRYCTFSGGKRECFVRNSFLQFFVDGIPKGEPLRISSVFQEKIVTTPMIEGGAGSKKDAEREMSFLQAVLYSGKLPVRLEMVSVEQIPPKFGRTFLNEVVKIGIVAELIILLVVFLRYRNFRIVLPMVLITLSEVIIILGIASIINWTIDMPSLAGIIAILGTGIDAQIMIIDEVLGGRKRIYSVTEKIKHAFFIIFSSAATTFVAMLPLLMGAGAKMMQGFAVTTIIGLAIAVFVTRPAFGKMVEEMMG